MDFTSFSNEKKKLSQEKAPKIQKSRVPDVPGFKISDSELKVLAKFY